MNWKTFAGRRSVSFLLPACFALLGLANSAAGRAAPIAMDGLFDDWLGVEVLAEDPIGGGGGETVDFQELSVANDGRYLFIRVRLKNKIVIQERNRMALYIDTDNDPATGIPEGDMGADLKWSFGERRGEYGTGQIFWGDLEIVSAPSHSGREFEISIRRNATPGGTPLFPSNAIRLLFLDHSGGDRIPGDGTSVLYSFDNSLPFDPDPIPLGKDDADDVRIMTYNVLRDGPWDHGRAAEQSRLLAAVSPDIAAFQEIYDHTGRETKSWVISRLGGRWFQAWDGGQLHTLSRHPFLGAWVASPGRAWATLIDLPDPFPDDLLLINVHLSCCTDDGERQRQIDEVMAFIREAKTPGGSVEIPRNTGIIILGDTNMYGDVRQVETMLTGDIKDNSSNGPDFRPDWDGTSFEPLLSRQVGARQVYTWYDRGSDYSPGHIDRISYSDSRLNVAKSFILHTPMVDAATLRRAGLLEGDSPRASDHIPHVVDLRGGEILAAGSNPPALRYQLTGRPNPFNPAATISFELDGERFVSLVVYDAAGRLVETLLSETRQAGTNYIPWEADDRLASGTYIVRLKSGGREAQIKITLVR